MRIERGVRDWCRRNRWMDEFDDEGVDRTRWKSLAVEEAHRTRRMELVKGE